MNCLELHQRSSSVEYGSMFFFNDAIFKHFYRTILTTMVAVVEVEGIGVSSEKNS